MSLFLSLSHIYFGYESAAGAIFHDLSISFSPGWTGVIGANGSGKSTLLKLAAGELRPDRGSVRCAGRICRCGQEVLVPPPEASALFSSPASPAFRLQELLRLEPAMLARWETLSMGERKKIQIGAALVQEPDILCVDEPTNHLDRTARLALGRALREFRGIGVLGSHDRELLDSLCGQCLFLAAGRWKLRAGGVTQGLAEERQENESRRHEREQLRRDWQNSCRELQRRREKEQAARRKNSKRKIARKDFDAKGKIDLARVSGRSRAASDLAKAQAKVVVRRREALDGLEVVKTPKLGLSIPYGCYSSRNLLLELPPQFLALGGGRTLEIPELCIGAADRIALTGDNGAGKSSLLRQIVGQLQLPEEKFLYMPQELPPAFRAEIFQTLQRLPREAFSRVMNVVASLGSRPEAVLHSDRCSPGEWRKLFFGLGVLREVNLIVLDEPTNHLDLPSIECLETALAGCRCALLLVSHDQHFLRKLCPLHWEIVGGLPTENRLRKGHW